MRVLPWFALCLAGILFTMPMQAGPLLLPVPCEDWEGKPVTLERLKEKVTVVISSSRETMDVGAEVDRDLLYHFGTNQNFTLIRVADLRNVPYLARDIVISTIKARDGAELLELKERFAADGQTASLQSTAFYILDWQGKFGLTMLQASPLTEYSLFKRDLSRLTRFEKDRVERERQKLANHLHVFVLDQEGDVRAHYLDRGAARQAIPTIRGLLPPA